MRFTIEGFNQQYAASLCKTTEQNGKTITQKIDCTDLVILRWFVDFFPNMKKETVNGKEYAYVSHAKLSEDLPLVSITKRAFINRMKKLVDFGILEYKLIKEGGTFSCYGFGDNYNNLIQSPENTETKEQKGVYSTSKGIHSTSEGMHSNAYGVCNQMYTGMQSNVYPVCSQMHTKDKSIINKSINKSIRNKEGIKKPPSIDYQKIVDEFNRQCDKLSKVEKITDTRRQAIKRAVNKGVDLSVLFDKVKSSDFLNGKNDRGWTASFDWILKPSNLQKIMEGNYNNRQPDKPQIYSSQNASYDLEAYASKSMFDD